MSVWDEPDFSPPFTSAPTIERKLPRIPTLAEQRRKIEKRCAERDRWPPTHIHSPSHREKTYKPVKIAP